MITLERVGLLTGTALLNLFARLRLMQQHPSSPAGEHRSLSTYNATHSSAVSRHLAQALNADLPAGA